MPNVTSTENLLLRKFEDETLVVGLNNEGAV